MDYTPQMGFGRGSQPKNLGNNEPGPSRRGGLTTEQLSEMFPGSVALDERAESRDALAQVLHESEKFNDAQGMEVGSQEYPDWDQERQDFRNKKDKILAKSPSKPQGLDPVGNEEHFRQGMQDSDEQSARKEVEEKRRNARARLQYDEEMRQQDPLGGAERRGLRKETMNKILQDQHPNGGQKVTASRSRVELGHESPLPASYLPPNQLARGESQTSQESTSSENVPDNSSRFEDRRGREALESVEFGGPDIQEFSMSSQDPRIKRHWSLAKQISAAAYWKGTENIYNIPGLIRGGESGFFEDPEAQAYKSEGAIIQDKDDQPLRLRPTQYVTVQEIIPLRGRACPILVPYGNDIGFIMVCRKPGDEFWSIPDIQLFHDVINRVECQVLDMKNGMESTLVWAKESAACGYFGLHSKSIPELEAWRRLITQQEVEGFLFNSFPQSAMVPTNEYSVMLRSNTRSFRNFWIPWSIFHRNTGLQGTIRITCYKRYGIEDATRNGISKEGWRLVYFVGDKRFQDAIAKFPSAHFFTVGSGVSQIRGGAKIRDQIILGMGPTDRRMRWVNPRIGVIAAASSGGIRQRDLPGGSHRLRGGRGGGNFRAPATPSSGASASDSGSISLQAILAGQGGDKKKMASRGMKKAASRGTRGKRVSKIKTCGGGGCDGSSTSI